MVWANFLHYGSSKPKSKSNPRAPILLSTSPLIVNARSIEGKSKLALGLFLEPTTRDVDEQAFPAPFAKSLLHEREHLSSETGLARSL